MRSIKHLHKLNDDEREISIKEIEDVLPQLSTDKGTFIQAISASDNYFNICHLTLVSMNVGLSRVGEQSKSIAMWWDFPRTQRFGFETIDM